MRMRFVLVVVILLATVLATGEASAQTASGTPGLKAGAAKVDITPAPNELPASYEGVHDRIYSRAIVIDNGTTGAVLITVDVGGLSEDTWRNVTQRIEKELGIPAKNVLITATHTHSSPRRQGAGPGLDELIFSSARQARSTMRPARIGYGSGVSFINVNRNIIDRKTRGWWEGPNYEGPSDKTVAVMTLEGLDGQPIAAYYNYAMHAVVLGQLDQVSGDVPGAASKYIEDSFDGKIIALWSTGAAGDQNPIYFQQTYDLREIRIKDYAKRGEDISNAMPPGGQGLNRKDPTVKRLMDQQKQMAASMGQFLGEEVLRVMRQIERTSTDAPIFSSQKTVTCPGRERTNQGRAGTAGTYKDGPDVNIKLSLLVINDIAIGGVNAEVFNPIAQRFKKESPFARSLMATLTNGRANSGYIPNDAAFGFQTFEVLSSRLKPGCAETNIVNGLLDLIDEVKVQR
jgi:neutral ceramidase